MDIVTYILPVLQAVCLPVSMDNLGAGWDTWFRLSRIVSDTSMSTEKIGMTNQYAQPLDTFRMKDSNIHPQNDMLSWLMDNARGDEKSLQNLTLRILLVNFAAIHITIMVLRFSYISAFLFECIMTELHPYAL